MTTHDQTPHADVAEDEGNYWDPDFALNRLRHRASASHRPSIHRPPTAAAVPTHAPELEDEDEDGQDPRRKRGRGAPPQYVPADLNLTAAFAARLRDTFGIPDSYSAARVARIVGLERTRVSRAVRGETLPSWETVETMLREFRCLPRRECLRGRECLPGRGCLCRREIEEIWRDWRNHYERAQTEVWRGQLQAAPRTVWRSRYIIGAGAFVALTLLVWLLASGSRLLSQPSPDPSGTVWPTVVVVPTPDRGAPDPSPRLPTIYESPSMTARELGKLGLAEVRCVLPADRTPDLVGWFRLSNDGWVLTERVTARDTTDITTVLSSQEIIKSVPLCESRGGR